MPENFEFAYSLCSLVNHIGATPAEGHYNVLLQNKREDSVVLLDDTSIQFNYSMGNHIETLQYDYILKR